MIATLNTTCWQGTIVSCRTNPNFFRNGPTISPFHLHLIQTENKKILKILSHGLKHPVEEMLYVSSGVVPVVLVVYFVGKPIHVFGDT